MNEELDKQVENKPERNALGQLLPGNTANSKGRPKGKTLKEYQAEIFRTMSDEEKKEWLDEHKISGIDQWKMSEGNPKQDTEVSGEITLPTPIIPLEDVQRNHSNQEDNSTN